MVQRSPSELYTLDETAWLEQTAELVRSGRWPEIDSETLAEYLTDMARRDRREVFSRLVVLLTHLLKWEQQAAGRSASWRGTIREQRRELKLLLESRVLRTHAELVFPEAYTEARLQAADETECDPTIFPVEFVGTLDDVLDPPNADA
ncbi:MAG: DUF29 domain-containing protein [Gemmataceae bacterium]|nr:DUF29 domain-containing protein [Gemmataceae bacterium]